MVEASEGAHASDGDNPTLEARKVLHLPTYVQGVPEFLRIFYSCVFKLGFQEFEAKLREGIRRRLL